MTRTQAVSANATNATLTSTANKDLIVVFAYRSGSTTAPSLPAGFTSLGTTSQGSGGTACSARWGYKISAGGDVSTGTWTNATQVTCIVYRGAITPGTNSASTGSGTSLTYPARTLGNTHGQTWVFGAGGARSATAGMNGNPSNPLTNETNVTTANACDTNGGVTSFASGTLSVTGSGNWIAVTIEIPPSPIDEDFWVPVLVLPPYSDARPSQLRFLVSGAGTKASPFVPDEDYWSGPRPVLLAIPVVFTDDDVWVPQPVTFVPDEDYWFVPLPVALPIPQAFTDDDVIEILQAAEEYWLRLPQPPVFPVPLVFRDDEIWAPPPPAFAPDEDYWWTQLILQLWVMGTLAPWQGGMGDEIGLLPPPPVVTDYIPVWRPRKR